MGCLKRRGLMQPWQLWADEWLLGTERGHMKGDLGAFSHIQTHPPALSDGVKW